MGGTSTATQRIPIVEVVVAGDLDVLAAPTVAAALERAGTLHPEQLIVDLTHCLTIDAAGIVLLLEAHRRAMRHGGTLALRSPSAKLQRNLQLAKLDRVLHVLAPRPPEKQDDNERLVP